jgi:putative MATE family efflux protein
MPTGLIAYGKAVLHWLNADDYLSQIFRLATPIAMQSAIVSGLSMAASIMIGQLGDSAIAAVGLANQIFFLLQLLLFGFNSGAAIFTAQLWGQQNLDDIHRVLGLSLWLSLASALIFFLVSFLSPAVVLQLYTRDPEVIALGAAYLRVFSFSFLFSAGTLAYSAVLRSIGEVRLPLLVSTGALGLSVFLSYGLIFGRWGLPQLGILGGAWSILIARLLEMLALLALVYWQRSPLAASITEMTDLQADFIWKVLRPVLPVALNELIWSFGITTYNAIYARMGTEEYAAYNMVISLDSLAFVFFIGLGNGCAILVGNQIGSGNEELAYRTSVRSLALAISGGIIVGALLQVVAKPVFALYQVTPQVRQYAFEVLLVITFSLWLRSSNMLLLIGAFRSGGDTRYGLLIESAGMWLAGVPMAYLAAFLLKLPIAWVYAFALGDELVKWLFSVHRLRTRRWIHNLAVTVANPVVETPSG